MDLSLKKKKVIDEINHYFLKKASIHNQEASNLLIKIDPKFRGLLFNSGLLKKIKVEVNVMMKRIALDFSEFLELTCARYGIQSSSVISVARSMLKNHQKLIIQNLLTTIRQKNPKLASNLKDKLDQFPDLVLPSIRKNNVEAFSQKKSKITILTKLSIMLKKAYKLLSRS